MIVNEVLVKELHKPEIKIVKRRKLCSRFKLDTWAADLVEMRLLSSRN